MTPALPQIKGSQLLKLLEKEGWSIRPGRARHGVMVSKAGSPTRIAIIPTKPRPLPAGTLSAILSEKQTGIGSCGLLDLIRKHGL